MCFRKLLFTLTACLLCFSVFAQQDQIQFSRLEISRGLSHNQVNAILKDTRGFMWFATLSGLNRYDGYEFKVFKHDPRDSTSLTDDFVTAIYQLPDNKLYLQTRSGPNVYDPKTETFIRKVQPYLSSLHIGAKIIRDIVSDKQGSYWFNATDRVYKYTPSNHTTMQLLANGSSESGLLNSKIAALQTDAAGNVWVIHQDRSIEMLNSKTAKVTQRVTDFVERQQTSEDYRLFVDQSAALWIYRLNRQEGINYYQPATGLKRYIDKGDAGLNNNIINGILQDGKGLIWIATDHGGINLLNPKDFKVRYLVNRENDPKSLGQNSVLSLYKDLSGIMWAGTFKKGISFYHEKILKFPLYRYAGNPDGLSYEDVNRFVEDDQGNIWIGTNGGGLFYLNRKTGKFKRYLHNPANPNSLSNDIIVSLYIDRAKKLWIGTYFGGLNSFDGQNFKRYKHIASDSKSLADDRVWDVVEDRKGNLWVATLSGGLDRLDRKSGIFYHKRVGEPNSVGSDFISCLIEDKQGNLWIGTSDGVDVLKANGQFIHYKNQAGQSNSLINNIVYDIMQDSYGFVWIATRDGISRINPGTGQFRNFDKKDGLTEKATLKILEDQQHNLWLSTSNGLFNILVSRQKNADFSYVFRKYDEQDGLQGSAFNANAGYKTRAGELIFGGANGFNLFQPQHIKNDQNKPAVVLSDLQIANRSVGIAEKNNGSVVLEQSIGLTNSLQLRYNQNGFTLTFAALHFFNPQKIKYRYMLEGFDHHWQELESNNRRATYTNIDPGKYIFRVMSTDASGNWSDKETKLQITILPPLWRTTFAYFLYVGIAGGSLLLIRRRGIKRIKREFLIDQERQQAKRMHDLDLLKIKFLTNVSHEFRTPLSLIITPMEKLIRQAPEAEKQQLQMIQRNGRRLLNLVNQLLDFRKMEVQELKIHPKTGDIIQFIQELCYSFSDVADRKNIALRFVTDRKNLVTLFDHDKIERIIFNLLSNAFKFTPQHGEVKISLMVSADSDRKVRLSLHISDTGIGIPLEKQEKIFERFFQHDVPDSMVNQGSGIGLSITKEFVRLHGGSITVDSQPNRGSTFTVVLLLSEVVEQTYPATGIKALQIPAAINVPVAEDFSWKSKKPVLMLVEDNEDFRFYLKDNLKEYYQIAEAANGQEGWQKILSLHPDLIVSDVSMPEMNGIDLCKKIKSDKRTAHLPVILLTALTTEDQQLSGLETGASDYMTKPFNFEILLSKIRNLLQQQALTKKTYQKQVDFRPATAEIESVDDKFIRQIGIQLEKHLADPAYTVDQLSTAMNMSRVGLYKKIIPLTGKSPIEYIRYYRLQKSKPLLQKSQLTIAEVAYEVGFSNPKHFSKYFKQEFGILPSAYALKKEDDKPV
jgi:signal transduction histidine kinase/ligand-binding sensor domain-containing protein/DNA-binding response OmpR family regulator